MAIEMAPKRPGMKTSGFPHQERALDAGAGKRNFGYLMEQGTGKSWTTIADAIRLHQKSLITAVFVLAPNGVHTNWTRREIPAHVEGAIYPAKAKPGELTIVAEAWKGTPSTKKEKERLERLFRTHYTGPVLFVFAMNIEALNSSTGMDWAKRFLLAHKCLAVCDESTRIKNHDAKRAQKAVDLAGFATARRILSGTPLTKSPADLFMQFEFLKKGILGTTSFRAFNSEFSVLLEADDPTMIAIMKKRGGKGWGIPQVVKKDPTGRPMYRNLEKLRDLIAPHSFRVKKEDCGLDIPPKIYQPIYFVLTPNQRKIYEQVREDHSFILDREGYLEDVSFEAIAARTKLKQITSGYINVYGEPILLPPEDNPRMDLFKDVLQSRIDEDESLQLIVWAQYVQELDQLVEAVEAMGLTCAKYNGETPKGIRDEIIDDFQAGKIQVFIGHAAAAGIGITLTAATCAIYYSCNEDSELRKQSEDRCHRIGTHKSVTYIDLIAEETIDEDVQANLAQKDEIAGIVIDGNPSN